MSMSKSVLLLVSKADKRPTVCLNIEVCDYVLCTLPYNFLVFSRLHMHKLIFCITEEVYIYMAINLLSWM